MWHLALGYVGVGIGVGLCLLGGAFGIARCASSALEGAARQPEAAEKLQLMMIIPAAMIEGALLFGLFVLFQAGGALNNGVPRAGDVPATATQAH